VPDAVITEVLVMMGGVTTRNM